MYRIRFHGRGGQGVKTASRMLGNAFLYQGLVVQDAPRYGAERRGAPIFAFVRAARGPINERGVIRRPDLVVVVDDTLVPLPAAGVTDGLAEDTVLLIDSAEPGEVWRARLNAPGPVLSLAAPEVEAQAERPLVGTACAAAAARLTGAIGWPNLERAVRDVLARIDKAMLRQNLETARAAYEAMARHEGIVGEGAPVSAAGYERPRWIELEPEPADASGPAIYGGPTSIEVRTGLWRIMRPLIDYDLCKRCVWVCGSFCPDSAIDVRADGTPEIDYDHCKGCMICLVQCPPHAIHAKPEREAQALEAEGVAA